MLQNQKQSTKQWIDLPSESQSEDQDQKPTHQHHQKKSIKQPTKQLTLEEHTSEQLANLKKAYEQVWLIITSTDDFSLKRKMDEVKKLRQSNPQILHLFQNKQDKSVWDAKVTIKLAQQWIKNGLDKQRNIKITVSPRSMKRRQEQRGQRGQRGNRGDRNGQYRQRGDRRPREGQQRGEGRQRRGRGGRDRGGGRGRRDDRNRGDRQQGGQRRDKKVSYVNKQTGERAKNKELIQARILEQKSRQYSKKQAQRRGLQLGNFRNKPKVQHRQSEQQQKSSHHSSQKHHQKSQQNFVNSKKEHKVKVDVNNMNELKNQIKQELVDTDNSKKLKPLWAFKQAPKDEPAIVKIQQKIQPVQQKITELPKQEKQNNWNRSKNDNKEKVYVDKKQNQERQNEANEKKQHRPYKKDYQNKEWKNDSNQKSKYYEKNTTHENQGAKPYRQKRQYNQKQESYIPKKNYDSKEQYKDNQRGNKNYTKKEQNGKKKYTSKNAQQNEPKETKVQASKKQSNINTSKTFEMMEVDSD